jgi:hypothetical protein
MRTLLVSSALLLLASAAQAQDTTVVIVKHIPSVQDTGVVVRHIDADSATARPAPRRMQPPMGPPYGSRYPASNTNTIIAKDPRLASSLSFIFPGGGQFYAENPGKGFLITALSIGAPIIGYNSVQHGGNWVGCYPGQGGPCYQTRTDWTPAAIGLTVGIGTWLYGIATAGNDALKWNKAHNVRFVVEPRRFGLAVAMP